MAVRKEYNDSVALRFFERCEACRESSTNVGAAAETRIVAKGGNEDRGELIRWQLDRGGRRSEAVSRIARRGGDIRDLGGNFDDCVELLSIFSRADGAAHVHGEADRVDVTGVTRGCGEGSVGVCCGGCCGRRESSRQRSEKENREKDVKSK